MTDTQPSRKKTSKEQPQAEAKTAEGDTQVIVEEPLDQAVPESRDAASQEAAPEPRDTASPETALAVVEAPAVEGTEMAQAGETPPGAETAEDISLDPAVIKLVEYAKEKKSLSYEELSDYLPEHIANTDKIEKVLSLLEKNNVQLVEEESAGEEERNLPWWTIPSGCTCEKSAGKACSPQSRKLNFPSRWKMVKTSSKG